MSDLEVDVFKISAPIMKMEIPDPFVVQFPNGGKLLFYKDGRFVGDFQNPDDSAKEFLKFVEIYYSDHIIEAEKRGAAKEREKHREIAGYISPDTRDFFSTFTDKYTSASLCRNPIEGRIPVYYEATAPDHEESLK